MQPSGGEAAFGGQVGREVLVVEGLLDSAHRCRSVRMRGDLGEDRRNKGRGAAQVLRRPLPLPCMCAHTARAHTHTPVHAFCIRADD